MLRPRPAVRRCHSGSGHSAPDHPVYSPSPALCPGSRRLRGTQKTGSLSLGASRPPGGAWHTGESAACGDIQAGPALGTRGQPAHVPAQRHPLITQRPETKAIPGQRFGARSLRMAHLCFALIVLHERARQQLSTRLGLKRAACRLEREKETESRDAERWRKRDRQTQRDRERDRQTQGDRERETDRHRETERERKTERQRKRERQMDTERERHRQTQTQSGRGGHVSTLPPREGSEGPGLLGRCAGELGAGLQVPMSTCTHPTAGQSTLGRVPASQSSRFSGETYQTPTVQLAVTETII